MTVAKTKPSRPSSNQMQCMQMTDMTSILANRIKSSFTSEWKLETMRTHSLFSVQFHALFNSLFKVLFNLPSRYFFAIGVVAILSFVWSLPHMFGLQSQTILLLSQSISTKAQQIGAYHPLWKTPYSTELITMQIRFWNWPYTTIRSRLPDAIRFWAFPRSFAITTGIPVGFFSSAY